MFLTLVLPMFTTQICPGCNFWAKTSSVKRPVFLKSCVAFPVEESGALCLDSPWSYPLVPPMFSPQICLGCDLAPPPKCIGKQINTGKRRTTLKSIGNMRQQRKDMGNHTKTYGKHGRHRKSISDRTCGLTHSDMKTTTPHRENPSAPIQELLPDTILRT